MNSMSSSERKCCSCWLAVEYAYAKMTRNACAWHCNNCKCVHWTGPASQKVGDPFPTWRAVRKKFFFQTFSSGVLATKGSRETPCQKCMQQDYVKQNFPSRAKQTEKKQFPPDMQHACLACVMLSQPVCVPLARRDAPHGRQEHR